MRLPRSSYYATPRERPSDAAIVAEIRAITDEFECYGYRRVGAELRHRGQVVNGKKVRRLMQENDLNPRKSRRFTRTTDSSHDGPVFPFVAKGLEVSGPDQLWVADITYVAVATGFVYLSVTSTPGRGGSSATPSPAPSRPGTASPPSSGRSRCAARRRAASSTPTAACSIPARRTARCSPPTASPAR